MSQSPSIGRIVHYHSYGTPGGEYLPEPRAAVITQVGALPAPAAPAAGASGGPLPTAPAVGLCVMNPTGLFFHEAVGYSEAPKPGHWSWPPRT